MSMPLVLYTNENTRGRNRIPVGSFGGYQQQQFADQRVVIGRLRRGSDRLGAINVEHQVDLGPSTAKKVDELRDAALTLRTGVIVVGVVGAIALAGLLIYLATRPKS
jgi:hypothetical protein